MTVFEKLAKRIKEDLDIDVDIKSLHRTYAGYWLRRSGAFLWCGNIIGTNPLRKIGSSYTASDLLKAKSICIYSEAFDEVEIGIP